MNDVIDTDNLVIGDLPRKYAKWSKIIEFASTFDLVSESENGIGFGVSGLHDLNGESSIKEIRAALYAEWRRYNHRMTGPDSEVEQQAWNAIEALRSKL